MKQTFLQSIAGPILAALCLGVPSAHAADLPAPVRALESRGLQVVGPMGTIGGLSGYAGRVRGEPVSVYVTADGKYAVVGTLVDAQGKNLTEAPLAKATTPKFGEETWKELAKAAWVADGRANAPRVVYAFTDPNCPYCSKFWHDARPWVDAGKVQIRHVMVGILGPTSPGKAAAILSAKDPSAALAEHEKHRSAGGVAALEHVDAATAGKLAANEALMSKLGSLATPTIFYRGAKGTVHRIQGAPTAEALVEVLGPR